MSDSTTPPADPDLEDIMAGIGRYEGRLAASNAKTKATVLAALAAAGVAQVVVAFHGDGDEGGVEDVRVINDAGDSVDLPDVPVACFEAAYRDTDVETVSQQPLTKAVEDLAMSYLAETHDGWENNDGGFGEVTFDVAAGKVTLDYNERFTETENHQHAF